MKPPYKLSNTMFNKVKRLTSLSEHELQTEMKKIDYLLWRESTASQIAGYVKIVMILNQIGNSK